MASSSSSRPQDMRTGNISKETDRLLHERSDQQLPAGGWDVFLSHSGAQKGFVKGLFKMLSPPYNVFFDITRPSLPLGERFTDRIFHAAKTCRVALVVLSNEFFCSKWPMLELSAFFDAGVQVLPLFYELSPQDLSNKEKLQEWDKRWEEFASKDDRNKVSSWARARQKLGSINGLVFKKSDGELAYLDEIVSTIYQMIPPLFRSSHAGVHGKDRLCKVFIDQFEELVQRPRNPFADLPTVYLLGVYGLPGSGKTTLCACMRDHFSSSFSGKALHLKLPTDPTPTDLLGIAKQLLKLTDLGHNREKMISEIEDLSQMYDILKASNLRSSRIFLVIDNISSQESIEAVKAILQLGVGEGSRVMLVARTREILCPLLNFPGNPHTRHIHYVCDSIKVPSISETEAICLLMQSASGLGLSSMYSQMEEKYNPIHRGILAKVACMCASGNQSHGDLLYLPLALKTIGPLLRSYGVDLDRQLSKLNTIMDDLKEVAVRKIMEESYQKLPKKLKLLFLDVALFMVPYCRFYSVTIESAIELLGFMHECRPETIQRELNDLMRLCFLESGWELSEFCVHDVFLEFAKNVPDASSMYYCRRRNTDLQEVASDLSMMERRSAVGLRALILEVDEKSFEFPASLSSVKVVVVRQCKSLEVLGLAGLTSLVSLEIENCPRLRHLDVDVGHAYTLKRLRGVRKNWGDCVDVADQEQQGSLQKSLLQVLQAGSGNILTTKWLISKVWCRMSMALGGWHHRPQTFNGFMSLASQFKALQVLRLEQTGITSLGDLSSCWPQLRVLEVLEGHLEVLEVGNLPNLKQFFYGGGDRIEFLKQFSILSKLWEVTRMLTEKPNLLAGCPELEDVRICVPFYKDGMPPNLRILWLKDIYGGEPVLLEFTSSAHLLEEICVRNHCIVQSLRFNHQFLSLVKIWLDLCPNLFTITGLERLPMLRHLAVRHCDKLQTLESLEALRMLERLELRECPVLTITSRAPSSQHLATIQVSGCPNVQFLASDLENLTALRDLSCNVFGSMLKLKNLVKLEELKLEWKRMRIAGADREASRQSALESGASAILPV